MGGIPQDHFISRAVPTLTSKAETDGKVQAVELLLPTNLLFFRNASFSFPNPLQQAACSAPAACILSTEETRRARGERVHFKQPASLLLLLCCRHRSPSLTRFPISPQSPAAAAGGGQRGEDKTIEDTLLSALRCRRRNVNHQR